MGEAFLTQGCIWLWEANPEWRNPQGAETTESWDGSQLSMAFHMVVAYQPSSPSSQFSLLRPKAIARDDLPLGREGGEEVRGLRLESFGARRSQVQLGMLWL